MWSFSRRGDVTLDMSRANGKPFNIGLANEGPRSGSKSLMVIPQSPEKSKKTQLIAAGLAVALISGMAVGRAKDLQFAAQSSAMQTIAANTSVQTTQQAVAAALKSQQAQFKAQLNLERTNSFQQGIIAEHKKLRCQQVVVGNRDAGVLGGWLGNVNTVWRGQSCQYTP